MEDTKAVRFGAEQLLLSTGEVAASAGPSGIRALSRSSIFLIGGHMGSSATALFLFDDLIITNVAHPGDHTPINIPLNFHLSGTLTLGDTGPPGPLENNSNAQLRVSFVLGTANAPNSSVGSICVNTDALSPCSSTGIFAGSPGPFVLNGNYKTSTHLVQVGVPQKVGLQLQVQTGAANLNDTRQEASADFLNTLDFVTGMPVFDLPTGYTDNSAIARIVDNQYRPVAVPLSPAWALLLAGGGVALRRMRSGNSRQSTLALSRGVRELLS